MTQPTTHATLALSAITHISPERLQKAVCGLADGSMTVTLTHTTDAEVQTLVKNGGGSEYSMTLTPHQTSCSCPDARWRAVTCKHALALAERPAWGGLLRSSLPTHGSLKQASPPSTPLGRRSRNAKHAAPQQISSVLSSIVTGKSWSRHYTTSSVSRHTRRTRGTFLTDRKGRSKNRGQESGISYCPPGTVTPQLYHTATTGARLSTWL
jgi:hypothetical protein